MAKCIVAVDGVVGAGKSTVCRMAGDILDWPALSTGVFYRTAAFIVQRWVLSSRYGGRDQATCWCVN